MILDILLLQYSVMPVLRKLEYLEIQRERNTLSAKLQWKALHLDGK